MTPYSHSLSTQIKEINSRFRGSIGGGVCVVTIGHFDICIFWWELMCDCALIVRCTGVKGRSVLCQPRLVIIRQFYQRQICLRISTDHLHCHGTRKTLHMNKTVAIVVKCLILVMQASMLSRWWMRGRCMGKLEVHVSGIRVKKAAGFYPLCDQAPLGSRIPLITSPAIFTLTSWEMPRVLAPLP